MKTVLLIGLGRFGKHVAMKLRELRHEVMAIDYDEKRVEAVMPYVTNCQIGDSTDENFMSMLGVSNFDVCIVAIGRNFQSSLETTALLKDLGAKFVVSRAERDVHAKFLLRNGADETVYPERQIAEWTAIRYSMDHVFDYIEVDPNHAIMEIEVPLEWVGKAIGHLDVRRVYGINILGIKRNGRFNLTITPETRLNQFETMLVIGSNRSIQKCFNI